MGISQAKEREKDGGRLPREVVGGTQLAKHQEANHETPCLRVWVFPLEGHTERFRGRRAAEDESAF